MFARAISAIFLAELLVTASSAKGQSPTPTPTPETVRVTVSMNADGSRTVYEFDPLHHKAKATTTDSTGKAVGTIRYINFRHPERNRGIPRNNLRRGPSTPLRSAQDDHQRCATTTFHLASALK